MAPYGSLAEQGQHSGKPLNYDDIGNTNPRPVLGGFEMFRGLKIPPTPPFTKGGNFTCPPLNPKREGREVNPNFIENGFWAKLFSFDYLEC